MNDVGKVRTKSVNMVRARTISVYLGGVLLIACAALMMAGDTLGELLWLLVMMGMSLFIGGMSEFIGLKKPLKDEWAARIGTLAATYSWYSVLMLVSTIVMIFGSVEATRSRCPRQWGRFSSPWW
jgi:hypothetical protein